MQFHLKNVIFQLVICISLSYVFYNDNSHNYTVFLLYYLLITALSHVTKTGFFSNWINLGSSYMLLSTSVNHSKAGCNPILVSLWAVCFIEREKSGPFLFIIKQSLFFFLKREKKKRCVNELIDFSCNITAFLLHKQHNSKHLCTWIMVDLPIVSRFLKLAQTLKYNFDVATCLFLTLVFQIHPYISFWHLSIPWVDILFQC